MSFGAKGIFELAERMRRTSGMRRTILDDTVIDGCAVGQQHSLEARQHSFRVASFVLLSKVEKYVSLVTVKPGVALMNFAEVLFDHRHLGGIRLYEPGFERELVHRSTMRLRTSAPSASQRGMDARAIGTPMARKILYWRYIGKCQSNLPTPTQKTSPGAGRPLSIG